MQIIFTKDKRIRNYINKFLSCKITARNPLEMRVKFGVDEVKKNFNALLCGSGTKFS